MVEQLLSSFIRIHIGFLESCIYISIGVITDDLFDGLDGFSNASREYVSPTVDSQARNHFKVYGEGGVEEVNAKKKEGKE